MGAFEAAHSSGQARWRPASCRRARACQRPELYPEHRLAVADDYCGSAAALEATSISICGAEMARSIASTMRFMRSAAKPPRARPARPPRSLTARASRARKKGPAIDPTGYDAGKKIKGKKWHILVDTQGPADARHRACRRDPGLRRLGVAEGTLFGAFPFLTAISRGRSCRARSNRFWRASTSRSSSRRVKPQASSLSQALDRRAHIRLARPLPTTGQGMPQPQGARLNPSHAAKTIQSRMMFSDRRLRMMRVESAVEAHGQRIQPLR
jgi:hypothetical protein